MPINTMEYRDPLTGSRCHFSLVRSIAAALVIVMCIVFPAAAGADDEVTLEQRVKAAFLYKFADYVEWPQGLFAQSNAALTIAVVGDDRLAKELSELTADHPLNGKPIIVQRSIDIHSFASIQILFVSKNASGQMSDITRALGDQPVLIVTDWEGALSEGSIINFMLLDGHVRFEIALDTAENRGLKLSSRLLAVAQKVRSGH